MSWGGGGGGGGAGIKDAHARNGSKRESPHWLGEAATAMRAQMSETLILAMHQASFTKRLHTVHYRS